MTSEVRSEASEAPRGRELRPSHWTVLGVRGLLQKGRTSLGRCRNLTPRAPALSDPSRGIVAAFFRAPLSALSSFRVSPAVFEWTKTSAPCAGSLLSLAGVYIVPVSERVRAQVEEQAVLQRPVPRG